MYGLLVGLLLHTAKDEAGLIVVQPWHSLQHELWALGNLACAMPEQHEVHNSLIARHAFLDNSALRSGPPDLTGAAFLVIIF